MNKQVVLSALFVALFIGQSSFFVKAVESETEERIVELESGKAPGRLSCVANKIKGIFSKKTLTSAKEYCAAHPYKVFAAALLVSVALPAGYHAVKNCPWLSEKLGLTPDEEEEVNLLTTQ